MTAAPLREALVPFLEQTKSGSPNAPTAAGNPDASAETILETLAGLIYWNCHCRGPETGNSGVPGRDREPEWQFRAALSDANTGSGPWQQGWVVRGAEYDGRVPVEQGGLLLWAPVTDVRGTPEIGQSVDVRFPNEYRNLYPGYYVALGNADAGNQVERLRFYWHIAAGGAALVVERLCTAFNTANVAFRFKLLGDPARYSRTDAGVLYVPLAEIEAALPVVRHVYDDVRDQLRPTVSAFVHALAPGLGLAEDPADSGSFGMHRSRLLAPLMLAARRAHAAIDQLLERIRETGYDPDRFFVNPGSTRDYPTWT